jgi:hypothetical protein
MLICAERILKLNIFLNENRVDYFLNAQCRQCLYVKPDRLLVFTLAAIQNS